LGQPSIEGLNNSQRAKENAVARVPGGKRRINKAVARGGEF